jgi:hypothetical protein
MSHLIEDGQTSSGAGSSEVDEIPKVIELRYAETFPNSLNPRFWPAG